jgi:hypothetical protein
MKLGNRDGIQSKVARIATNHTQGGVSLLLYMEKAMTVVTLDVEVESIDHIVRDELRWHYEECNEQFPDDVELKQALETVLKYYGEEI